MRFDLYHAECVRIAHEQKALLDEARQRIQSGVPLTKLEQNGVLHAFQILIENAIGKSKHLLKTENQTVPISAYGTFAALARLGKISEESLERWNATIGLRNKLVRQLPTT